MMLFFIRLSYGFAKLELNFQKSKGSAKKSLLSLGTEIDDILGGTRIEYRV